ncbi:hypothetical protein CYMTET_53886 [Cymbomonas tetramitiformis]|uniref:Uncharacterized protein n=1 Tax=Cymbomonas tetramitiformis TaxID=36881 RepID=A0AAE0BH89_9CHLO|nr:hypothetical protein CYMTET_53886 [Cymbomonas tetramitiformis]
MDTVVSAFQTAFNDEDDANFAQLCQRYPKPTVRDSSEPFTYSSALDLGLRAQYAGMGAPHPDEVSDVVSETRTVLASLRAAATEAGGAAAPPSLHLGAASVPQVVSVPPPAEPPDLQQPLQHLAASDSAAFEPPFQQSFMDDCFAANLSLQSHSVPAAPPCIPAAPLSDVGSDDGHIDDSDIDQPPAQQPAVASRPVGPARLPQAIPFLCISCPATFNVCGLCKCSGFGGAPSRACLLLCAAAVHPAVHPDWVAANICTVGSEISPPALPHSRLYYSIMLYSVA